MADVSNEQNGNIPLCALRVHESQRQDAPWLWMDKRSDTLHPAYMPSTDDGRGHFLRAWRLASNLTLEQAAERVQRVSEARADADPLSRPIGMTHATLSRIERGKLPYSQILIEILAEVYRTDRASLLMRDPADPEGLWSIWEQLRPIERRQAVEVIKAIHRTRSAA